MSIMNNYVVYSENTGLANRSFLEHSKVVNRKVEFHIYLNKLSAMESSTLTGMSLLPHTHTHNLGKTESRIIKALKSKNDKDS